ncbi:MAG: phytoene/squalene synthase family protein [Phycisphaerales bacterium]|nr:phytoene/squalene synthase family protein [Phycisphaerales bacterium]
MSARGVIANSAIAAGEALRFCRDVTRTRARNFYYGLKLSPEPQRSALYAVYAWMRAADDLVDGVANAGAEQLQARVQGFRAATDAALTGHPEANPLWVGLAHIAERFRIPAEHFHSMLDGQLEDLARTAHQSFDQLRGYCYRVASTVGLVCIEIWGYTDDKARDLAIDRGIAFQLTNILRDYKQDFDAGRLYLPLEDFQRHQLDPAELRTWSKPTACQAMLREQIERAQSYYERSAGLEELISARCRPTLWAMTRIYRGLLDKIGRNPSRLVLSHRLRLSAARKGAIALRAKWRARAARHSSAHSPTT